MNITTKGALLLAASLLLNCANGQTDLNFNGVSVTAEGAIRLSWNSTPNEIYEIDEADSLIDPDSGNTPWRMLYEDYPSQGTNTFWLDTGNYFADPEIPHPTRSLARFYRIVLTGTNGTATVPVISVGFPSNNASLSGQVTVVVNAASDQPFLFTKLYVDGQEMNPPDVSTNWTDGVGITNFLQDSYVLNSCEWPNGPHTFFATARCESGASGTHDVADVDVGYSVSSFVPVTFSNLITRISFSQPFFTPEDGQTQRVTAIFSANVDWTLNIWDASSNAVRTVGGSGGSMLFNWDGLGQGGTNLPVGRYTYFISAQTNGQPLSPSAPGGGSSGSSASVASGTDGSEGTRVWVQQANGVIVPLSLYPPGIDTNGFDLFEAPASWNPYQRSSAAESPLIAETSGADGPMGAWGGSSSQGSWAPLRPPINPVKGRAGVYGIAYQTYSGNSGGFTLQSPDNGLHIGQRIQLEGRPGDQSTFHYPRIRGYQREANNFIGEMKKGNWAQGFARVDDALKLSDLTPQGANIFNTVKLGLLMLHGTYGASLDYNANGTKQIYFPVASGHSAQYIRANQMNLGGFATNGLKWMGILACNSLQHTSWASMQSGFEVPNNSTLHLILGSDATIWTGDHVASYWGKYMLVGKTNSGPMQIEDAWYAGAEDAYGETRFAYTNTMKFAASGDAACRSDKLQSSTDPTGSSFYNSVKVWPLP